MEQVWKPVRLPDGGKFEYALIDYADGSVQVRLRSVTSKPTLYAAQNLRGTISAMAIGDAVERCAKAIRKAA